MLPRPVGSLAAVLSLTLAAPAVAQQVTTTQNVTITVHGIFSGSLYAQDADFLTGNGQRAEFPSVERNNWDMGGDVRNLRITLGIAGPEVRRGWRANGTIEMDFFGAFVGAGNFADEQPEPRLRLAYVDLTNGRTTWRFGQAWSLTLGNVPVSTSHIGFPLGWGSGGFVGWRFPGVWFIKTLSAPNARTTTRASIAVMKNSWSDESGAASDPFSAGERGSPQLEGRLDVSTRGWSGYVVGHVDSKDNPTITSTLLEVGASTTKGDWSLAGNAHTGKAMAHQFAQQLQFGDIKGWGAWAQAGYNVNATWSVWGYFGLEHPDEGDARAAAQACVAGFPCLKSWLAVPMIRYKSGPYAAGLEWMYAEVTVGPTATTEAKRKGNQVAVSVRYDF